MVSTSDPKEVLSSNILAGVDTYRHRALLTQTVSDHEKTNFPLLAVCIHDNVNAGTKQHQLPGSPGHL